MIASPVLTEKVVLPKKLTAITKFVRDCDFIIPSTLPQWPNTLLKAIQLCSGHLVYCYV